MAKSANLGLLGLLLTACATEALAPLDELTLPATPTAADDTADELRVMRSDLLSDWLRDGDWLVSPPLPSSAGVRRVGVLAELLAPDRPLHLEAQTLNGDAVQTPWQPLQTSFAEGELRVAVASFALAGSAAQLRMPADEVDGLHSLQWNAVTPDPGRSVPTTGFGEVSGGLAPAWQGLGIVTREQWQARPTKCTDSDAKKRHRIAIHHTETQLGNPAQRVRAIQAFHMDSRGWCDIGYHFLVGGDGKVFEGRPYALVGAHTGGQNAGNIGVSFIGCFHPSACAAMPPSAPPVAMLQAGGRLLGSLRQVAGIELTPANVKGHREHAGQSTACPGDALHAKLGVMMAMGKSATLATPTDAVPVPDQPPPEPPPPPPPDPAKPVVCSQLGCDTCKPSSGCQWCSSQASCQPLQSACTWQGYLGLSSCPTTFSPCALATCWNPSHDVPLCGSDAVDENFSSGKFRVHRYWTRLPAGAPVLLKLQRTAGNWSPSLILTDQTGKLISAGDPGQLHPKVKVTAASSGRAGDTASVVLEASAEVAAFVLVTSWQSLDAGLLPPVPQNATYRLVFGQSCQAPAPTAGDLGQVHGGLSRDGMEIPRAGLANPTLQQVFGIANEPWGKLTVFSGLNWVQGPISEFGGPNDTGVTATETGAISGEVLRKLNDPLNPSQAVLAAQAAKYYYIAMRFNYTPAGKSWWTQARILAVNPKTGAAVVLRPVDWGPAVATKRVGDLSPQAAKDLGLQTDQPALFAFAKPGTPLGKWVP